MMYSVHWSALALLRSLQCFLGLSFGREQCLLDVQPQINGQECKNTIDGSDTTTWQTQHNGHCNHYVVIDLRHAHNITALRVAPSLAGVTHGGSVGGHRILLSQEENDWSSPAVAYGTWADDGTDKWAIFEPQSARYVRLEATSATKNQGFITLGELDIWVSESVPIVPADGSLGRWGPTINFPLVPVSIFVDPVEKESRGNIIVFSSNSRDGIEDGEAEATRTAIWDRIGKRVSEEQVKNTHHQMFCPGTALDVNGSVIITGGASAAKTTVYDPVNKDWKPLHVMKLPRGYQGAVTLADGRMFVIGGSWSPSDSKDSRGGEIYDPFTNEWKKLENCSAEDIRTKTDGYLDYRADNHVWLMAWKDNWIFHAGPAADMHWINTTAPNGALKNAGKREEDGAMCGIAVMYDAAEGEILTAGGAPDYGKKASGNAFIIKLNKTGEAVTVAPAGKGLRWPRTFLNAVVLPNGDTFVAGGMLIGQPYNDTTAVFTPELWSLKDKAWKEMAPNSIPRTYHSVGLLLPDATVLVGGGGLANNRTVNHLDAQIYTPPYLIDKGPRPVIKSLPTSPKVMLVMLGQHLVFSTDSEVVDASLIRYGAATHNLNNDQRRIRLTPERDLKSPRVFKYRVKVPENPGVAIPGYWMLFVMNKAGVPSVAATVQDRRR
ncbi:galactose oxidase precursor [Echria macrotheca]|uniref:Galactose oxidase n=1 Tax=Echria macrotheca TaxID=438768 RepID=A0AAJ0BNJ2_9PEZI|nr:galactose oxidase precursor [Echria macrotheca]